MDKVILAALLVCGCAMVWVLIDVARDDSGTFVAETRTRTALHRLLLIVMWSGFVLAVVIILLTLMVMAGIHDLAVP